MTPKSEKHSQGSKPIGSGMASPVSIVLKTPSDHVSIKQERSSSRRKSKRSGMASVVGAVSGSHSSKSLSVGSAFPASSGSMQQSPQTIASTSGSARKRSGSARKRGRQHGSRNKPWNPPSS